MEKMVLTCEWVTWVHTSKIILTLWGIVKIKRNSAWMPLAEHRHVVSENILESCY